MGICAALYLIFSTWNNKLEYQYETPVLYACKFNILTLASATSQGNVYIQYGTSLNSISITNNNQTSNNTVQKYLFQPICSFHIRCTIVDGLQTKNITTKIIDQYCRIELKLVYNYNFKILYYFICILFIVLFYLYLNIYMHIYLYHSSSSPHCVCKIFICIHYLY